ncbi:hypothetical protein [Dyadobacter sp. CY356]|uniref:hypothetical protein n=1 Tax=Dyadobacter sp. CY356 TaxID=2906442 RepID=UPI001F3FD923|nr:hypothetical protein [Dyadobacter sp. CY356]MCF0054329.1 hypothetical protein [Dyadobacter sp. CY356]
MRQKKLEIDSIDLHYLLSLASLAKPRQKLLRSMGNEIRDSVIASLTVPQRDTLVADAVEDAIIKIGKFPGTREELADDLDLSNLNFNSLMYTRLSAVLTDVIHLYGKPEGSVGRDELISAATVGKIKKRIISKL